MKAVSGKRMCKALEGKGWLLKRIKGSHHIYAHASHLDTIISVPVHANRMLKKGTQQGIMKDAGLTDADL
ncbi:MAG TPA: type II toxin-antitoxin system HicA family toxin [Pirellulales bacterium]|nr:type II toxin-antitoxin system HicA family toxin [Pirellulales bacterium]